MVKTIVTGNTKKDHSDRPAVVLSEIERDVRISRMKRVSCENTSEFGLGIDEGYNLLTRLN